jgi:hypothetical protein
MEGPLFLAHAGKYADRSAACRAGLGLLLLSFSLAIPPAIAGDTRSVFTGEAMPWLSAVGKLSVPGQRHRDGRAAHYIEDCSATLVALPGSARADTVISAWHCLELYGDLSRPIVFTASTPSGEIIMREARLLADGGGMHADWAILRLAQPVSRQLIPALNPHPGMADPAQPVTMAGYSRDEGLGKRGEVMTFDPGCAITGQSAAQGETNCIAFKGASGGAVVQVSPEGEARVCGVVSRGNGSGYSTYVPVKSFNGALRRYLR